jgi:hypothetical protein
MASASRFLLRPKILWLRCAFWLLYLCHKSFLHPFQHIDIFYWDPTGVCESGIARRADLEVLVSFLFLLLMFLPFSYP